MLNNKILLTSLLVCHRVRDQSGSIPNLLIFFFKNFFTKASLSFIKVPYFYSSYFYSESSSYSIALSTVLANMLFNFC